MAIKRDQIVEAIHTGTKQACRTYTRWSDGWTLKDSGVEGLLVVEIAKKLDAKLSKAESLLLEVPFKKIIEWSGTPTVGRQLTALKGRTRADIVLFNGGGRPVCVIEVKRHAVERAQIEGDLDRLRGVVHKCANQKGGTLKRAFLAIYRHGRTKGPCKWVDGFFDANRDITCRSCKVERFKGGSSIHVEITDGPPTAPAQGCCWR